MACHPKVLELVEHLRSTGTGKDKLATITKIGEECGDDREEFLKCVRKALSVNPATLKKIDHFITLSDPPATGVTKLPATTEQVSEVADLNVHEAADKISRMISEPKLEHIVATDKRQGVIDAANKRLSDLKSPPVKESAKGK